MLKINLLPQEKGRRTSSAGSMASMLLVAVVGSLVLLLGGLFLFHASQQAELDDLVAGNNRMQAEIDSIKSRVSDHQRIVAELAEIRQREAAIQQLQAARTGPTAMLVEISRILSPGGAPTADAARVDWLRQHDRSRLWSPTWDTHRVWLTSFEEENRVVKISGQARDSDDVGELMRRLQLSLYFEDVRLERTQEVSITGGRAGSTLAVHSFMINARERY
jgi:type IV pilus assembly protein PilN